MPGAEKDFFISYNKNDLQIAEWIAWELEEAHYSVIIQAWDFKGNWVQEMDKAMQLCERTIAVLSSHYINAKYTFTEWFNSFIDDPKGEEDKLITVRVEDIELKGILRQLEYVDFVNKTENEAKELLLKRVRGERGKPSAKPAFNLKTRAIEIKHEAVRQKPVFPAAQEDDERIKKLREIIIQWRGKYALETKRMDDYTKKLESWRKKAPSDFNEEINAVIQFAYKIACDFRALPLADLEKATAYGLQIHPTVFWGQAIDQAFHMRDIFDEEGIELYKNQNMQREKLGMKPMNFMPDGYSYEMLERLLKSAVALFNFNINDLPRGFLLPTIEEAATGIGDLSKLVLAQFNYDDPRLYLISVDSAIKKISSFAARKLTLYTLYARVNTNNKLDLLASDSENLYVWQSSVQQPVYQFACKGLIVAATLHAQSSMPWGSYLTSKGLLFNIGEDGTLSDPPCFFQSFDLNTAVFWDDPLNKNNWYVIASTDKHEIYAALHGEKLTGKLNTDGNLWRDPSLISESEKEDSKLLNEYRRKKGSTEVHEPSVHWESECKLKMAQLDGLPCLLLYRHANTGARLFFLDPVTLGFLRSPVIIEGFLDEVSIASGRWLVIGFLQRGEPSPRIKVWDLKPSEMVECGSWLHDKGDVYQPIIVDEGKTAFGLLFIHRYLNPDEKDNWRLMSFKWPAGKIVEIERFEKLALAPVQHA